MNMVNLKICLQTMWVDLEITILSEVSQTEVEKYHMILLICRILKKKKKVTNELICKPETGSQT